MENHKYYLKLPWIYIEMWNVIEIEVSVRTKDSHLKHMRDYFTNSMSMLRYTLSIHAIESMADSEMAYELKQAIGN